MDDDRLQEILSRANAALPGRWSELLNKGYFADGDVPRADEYYTQANNELALHARQDIPDLIAALREAREQLKQIELATNVIESIRSQTIEMLEKQRDEAREVVIEADSMYSENGDLRDYETAAVAIQMMAGQGRNALTECEELRRTNARLLEYITALINGMSADQFNALVTAGKLDGIRAYMEGVA